MKKLFFVLLAVMACVNATATTYGYLRVKKADGTEKALPTDGLKLTYNNGQMVATRSSESTTFALSTLSSMYFSDNGTSDATTLVGDVNQDGKVDVTDVTTLINMILGNVDVDATVADLNGDQDVNVSDVTELINIILGTSEAPSRVKATADDIQTMWVCVGEVKYAFPTEYVDIATYSNSGATLTVLDKSFSISEIDSIYIDNEDFSDGNIAVTYAGNAAEVVVAGDIASHITAMANNAHVAVLQDATVVDEYVYTLQGTSSNGSFYHDGEYKISLALNGVTLNNPDSAAINIRNGKRIAVELVAGTTSTLTDGANGSQKGCFAVKGHAEFKNGGTLNITGNSKNAFWGKEYVELKKTVGAINILGAVADGFNVNQYYEQKGGTVTIKNVGDDGIQVSYETDDDDVVLTDAENTGEFTLSGGSINMTLDSDGGKGIKTVSKFNMSGGSLTMVQSGNLVIEDNDISYSTCVKADSAINITGGTIDLTNTAPGGKGLNTDGTINIDESKATTNITVKANGAGGAAEVSGSGGGSTQSGSYKMYVSLPNSGGGMGPGGGSNPWSKVYLYKSDGTLVQQLTQTTTRTAGYSTVTFYYYDFQANTTDTYYFKADDYTSRGTTYTIRTSDISGPTDGADIYYSISNSYTTSGTTRTYSLTNVTTTYGGSSDQGEDSGESYNASGIKADGDITIGGGTITVQNSGAMSKSIKSKATVTINGGNITLTPTGAMQVISSDASYSQGVKSDYYVQNGGSVTINSGGVAGKGISTNYDFTVNGGTLNVTATGAGQYVGSNRYTTKGLKADGNMTIAAGTVTVATTQNGAKAIKVNGNYVQGTSDGNGPTVTLSTQGQRLTNGSSSGGWGGGMGGKTTGQGGAAKGIKAEGTLTIYGGTTQVTTQADGGEGLEGKNGVYINGGQHYLKCYDDCISTNGPIQFNGGITVAYSFGNDAVDSNYGRSGAITIGNGVVLAYATTGGAEEGLDCDNNSYIQITGTGIAISAGGSQGGGGWGGSGNTISGAKQGYYFHTSSISYASGRYYTLSTSAGQNLVTYSFPEVSSSFTSSLSLFTATGMTSGSSYKVTYSTTAPTDATTAFHGLYLGSSQVGSSSLISSFSAK